MSHDLRSAVLQLRDDLIEEVAPGWLIQRFNDILEEHPDPTPPAPADVIEVACRGFYSAAGVHWDTLSAHDQGQAAQCMGEALIAVGEWAKGSRS